MSKEPGYGELLLQWLPAVWRERDAHGDLRALLQVYGELLDAFDATVSQRLYDSFPDQSDNGEDCQGWLLPYIAQLLDVRLVSPDEAGRRAEVADAVALRQRKGTSVSVERIAEAVGRLEVEIQEGWKRVAVTPRVDRPLLPEAAYGESAIPKGAGMAERSRHPGLPSATIDTRYCSRAVRCDPDNPGAHTSTFAGVPIAWRQVNRHGVPCAPGTFQDVSRRTVDVRSPSLRRGQVHPRRVMLYYPPQEGFFSSTHESADWSSVGSIVAEAATADMGDWTDAESISCVVGKIEVTISKTRWNGSDMPRIALRGLTDAPLLLHGAISLATAAVYRFENFWLDDTVQIDAGAAQFSDSAVRHITVTSDASDAPVIEARASLFQAIEAANGLVRLEYVTVLGSLLAKYLEASDSILLPPLCQDAVGKDVPAAGCIRYSRLFYVPEPVIPSDPNNPDSVPVNNDPRWCSKGNRSLLRCFRATCTTETPWFWNSNFGQPGCGVLRPDAEAVFLSGAEDGGEMGACHDRHYVLRLKAVLEKLKEFLPLGMEAVPVADATLACAPPREKVG